MLEVSVAWWVNGSPIIHVRPRRLWNWISKCPSPPNTPTNETHHSTLSHLHLACLPHNPIFTSETRPGSQVPSLFSTTPAHNITPSANPPFWLFWQLLSSSPSAYQPSTHTDSWKRKGNWPQWEGTRDAGNYAGELGSGDAQRMQFLSYQTSSLSHWGKLPHLLDHQSPSVT